MHFELYIKIMTEKYIFAVVEDMNWVQRKVHLYNVTFGLYMLDWWERCSFSILYCTFFYIDFDSFRCLFLRCFPKVFFCYLCETEIRILLENCLKTSS
jgi:hypothetical protein